MKLIVNDELVEESNFNISKDNRAFRYADGLFESMKYSHGKVHFLEDHYFRLMGSMRFLRMEIPMTWTPEFLEEKVKVLMDENGLSDKAAKLRLTVYRSGGGLYKPNTNQIEYLIECSEVEHQDYVLNEKGLNIEAFQYHHKPAGLLSNMKTLSCSIYTLATIFAKENGLDDALLLNEAGLLLEASSANIFLLTGNKVSTPRIENGCLKGIVRKVLVEELPEWGYEIEEKDLRPFDLVKAEEVFLTNASSGIRWVAGYKKKNYTNDKVKDIAARLNKLTSYKGD